VLVREFPVAVSVTNSHSAFDHFTPSSRKICPGIARPRDRPRGIILVRDDSKPQNPGAPGYARLLE
jgi:hypothetical protein